MQNYTYGNIVILTLFLHCPSKEFALPQVALFDIATCYNYAVFIYLFNTAWRENFEGCKLWRNGKENINGEINFGEFMMKV